MPCLFAVIALFAPRLTIVLLWLLTDWFSGIFDTVLWPIVGFIFLPTTLLWYTAVQHWFGGVWGVWPVIGLVIALAIDVSPAKGARRSDK